MGGGVEIDKVFKGTELIFNRDSYVLRHKPSYGYFKLTTCDVDENPVGNVPCLFRYGGRTIALEYSYNNIDWTSSNSATTILTSSTGEIYLRCPVSGNRQVNTTASTASGYGYRYGWNIGKTTEVYYKIEGDLRMLLDKNLPSGLTPNEYAFWQVWSNSYYEQTKQGIYMNQCIDANVIVPDGGTGNLRFIFVGPFGSKIRCMTLWKDGRWNNGTEDAAYNQWCGEWTVGVGDKANIQLSFKSWPTNKGIGKTCFNTDTPSDVKFYIPNELPEQYGDYRLPLGCVINRYNVDAYI